MCFSEAKPQLGRIKAGDRFFWRWFQDVYGLCLAQYNKVRFRGNGSRHGFPVLFNDGLHVFTHIWAKLCSVWIQTLLLLMQLAPRLTLSLRFAVSTWFFNTPYNSFENQCIAKAFISQILFNPLNAELNPICHLLAVLVAHHILHVSRVRVKERITYHVCITSTSKMWRTAISMLLMTDNSKVRGWRGFQDNLFAPSSWKLFHLCEKY